MHHHAGIIVTRRRVNERRLAKIKQKIDRGIHKGNGWTYIPSGDVTR